MSGMTLEAAVLILSETASEDPSLDKCIPALRDVFETENKARQQWNLSQLRIIPDNMVEIQQTILEWTDGVAGTQPVNLIVTSGGTGFAEKDRTPEAVSPLIHKHAPGLVHGMLSASLSVTPFAMMSRPVAGTRNKTLILTLPGSPKGAKENLESVIKLLPHACMQAAGIASSRSLHAGGVKKLEADAGVSAGPPRGDAPNSARNHIHTHHDHHHDHHHAFPHAIPRPHTDAVSRSNDPTAGPTHRNRTSPYPMLSASEALSTISTHTPAPITTTHSVNSTLINHVLASDIHAPEPVPAFRASIVDGYAVTCPHGTNTKGTFPVAFAVQASHSQTTSPLQPQQIARITTGAPLPPGADAVVMVEDTAVRASAPDACEEAEVEILTDAVKAGENVREPGSDVAAGAVIMRQGEGVSATGGEFALLASVGVRDVAVYQRPVVGVLSTGDEIVPHDARAPGQLRLGEVRDTNRPSLLTAVRGAGFEAVDLGIVSDQQTSLESALRHSLAKVDVLVTSGGVSMGEHDLLKPTLERQLGGSIHFGRVSMKPGKPTTFATIPCSNLKDPESGVRGDAHGWDRKVVFALPGNPASAIVTFQLFVLPSLHGMSGVEPRGLPRVGVRLGHEFVCDKMREEYQRVVVGARGSFGSVESAGLGLEGKRGDNDDVEEGQDAGLWASSTGGQRSSRVGSFKGANALLKLPAGGGTIGKGKRGVALLMGPLGGLARVTLDTD